MSTYRGHWLLLLVCSLFIASTNLSAGDWPQFRGPNCSGIATGAGSLPVQFSGTENVRWSADVGDGIGSPIVCAGRAYIGGMTGEQPVSLFAFDVESG